MSEPIVIELSVSSGPEHTFATWTSGIDRWWPADHTVSGAASARVVLEPRAGGRIFERERDGTEHEWGRVERCDPPHELAYTWWLGAAEAGSTDVRITFAPDGDGTAIRIEHSGWERLGAGAAPRRRANLAGWNGLLPHIRRLLAGDPSDSG